MLELPPDLLDVFVLTVELGPLAGGPLETTGVEWVGTFEVVGTVTTGAAGTVAAVVVTGVWLVTVLWTLACLSWCLLWCLRTRGFAVA
ncbi:MAG: hypothetical protein ACRDNS_08490 [Trebonia sp.]